MSKRRAAAKPLQATPPRDAPASLPIRASFKPSQACPLTAKPSSTRSATRPINKNSSTGRSSKLGREAFTFKAPVAPQGATEGKPASDKLLLKLGFLLRGTYWYHPQAIFGCVNTPSKTHSFCKWRRGTISRCPPSTGTVTEVESLFHPPCLNTDCQWNSALPRVIRLSVKKTLVTIDLEVKGKNSERTIEPSLKDSSEEPVKKRQIKNLPLSSSASTATPQQARQTADPSPPLPSASSSQARGTKRKEPPPAESPPPQMSKALRIDVTTMPGFQDWEANRALSTDEKLAKAIREIAELKARIVELESGVGKGRKGN